MKKYCLDTNIFIEPWNKFYSIKFTKGYWDILESLAKKEVVFSTIEVKREIECIDIYELIQRLKIEFTAKIKE